MKLYRSILTGLLLALTSAATSAADTKPKVDAHRFVFYAVLEGCYEEGLSSNEVAQILMRREGESYYHFIYACPLCMPALHAFDVYRSQPAGFFGTKIPKSTFGPGLDPDLRKQLFSEKTEDRLAAINVLVQRWIKQRMDALKFTDAERAHLQKDLETMRKKGMAALQSHLSSGHASKMAPAFGAKDECAICNAAVGMSLRLHEPK